MLTESEMARIRAEEVYREEVRKSLHARSSTPRAVLQFFNSGLGLWLLSAIFITGAGAAFQSCQSRQAEARNRAERIDRLDYETSHRFSRILHALKRSHTSADSPLAASPLKSLDTSYERYDSLYPEFSRFSLAALVAELRRIVPTPRERSDLDTVLVRLGARESLLPDTLPPEALAKEILADLVLKRWKGSYFYYIDCPPDDPFC